MGAHLIGICFKEKTDEKCPRVIKETTLVQQLLTHGY